MLGFFVIMRFLAFLLLLTPVVYGAAVEKCAWGESYWCSEFSIAKTCGAVKHCTTTVWKNQLAEPDISEVCEFCQSIIKDVHSFIKSKKTESEIAHFLSTACAIIPEVKVAQECKTIVEEYTPEIIDLIVSEVTPQMICRLMHLCTGIEDTVKHADIVPHSQLIVVPLSKTNIVTSLSDSEPKICTDCQAFFGDIVQMVVSNETLSELESLIDQAVCSELGSYRKECNDLVQEFLPMAMQYVQQFLDPKQLCQSMGFCTPTSDRTRLLFEIIKSTPLMNSLKKVGSAENCLICKTVLTEVRQMIRNAKVQTEIKEFLKTDVCSNMGSLKDSCIRLIDEFAVVAFEYLATTLDPDTRCRSFGFCDSALSEPSATDSAVVREATPPLRSIVAPASGAECIMCEFIMKEVDSLIQNNYTEAKIMEALDKVCSILPSTVKQSCLDFINVYGRAVLSILETELNPAVVCTFLGLCKSNTAIVQKYEPKVKDAETCLICETAIQYAEAMLSDNATVEEIDAVLKKICNFLPDTMKTECTSLIDQYSEEIIKYITSHYTPKEVCTLIKLCDGDVAVHMVNLAPAKSRIVKDCSHGPVYWCASQRNAEECGAVEHCKKYVWMN